MKIIVLPIKTGESIYGLKPYIHYSCRYKGISNGKNYDVVITYSLDNYITVQGIIDGKGVNESGYLLDNIDDSTYSSQGGNITHTYKYRGIKIESEELKEFIDKDKEQNYVKINGIKYYYDGRDWYHILNGERRNQGTNYKISNEAAIQYYKEAYDFTKWVKDNLSELNTRDAYDEEGLQLKDEKGNPKFGNGKIFDFGSKNDVTNGSIEDPDSDFNQHRLAIIRYSIEKNLSVAIANYNNYTGVQTEFLMPALKEDEWTKIINNVSIISFLQGLNIGSKVYNGYSIITNTKNKEVVREDSIYLADNNNYYKPTDDKLLSDSTTKYLGVLNIDFERRTSIDTNGLTTYFFPKKQLGSYTSIVNNSTVDVTQKNMFEYIDSLSDNIKKAYYTALGRERYSMYRSNNDINSDGMKKAYIENGY